MKNPLQTLLADPNIVDEEQVIRARFLTVLLPFVICVFVVYWAMSLFIPTVTIQSPPIFIGGLTMMVLC